MQQGREWSGRGTTNCEQENQAPTAVHTVEKAPFTLQHSLQALRLAQGTRHGTCWPSLVVERLEEQTRWYPEHHIPVGTWHVWDSRSSHTPSPGAPHQTMLWGNDCEMAWLWACPTLGVLPSRANVEQMLRHSKSDT